MRADRVGDRHRLVAGGAFEINGAHVAWRDQVDAGVAFAAQHDAAAAHIGEARAGKQCVIDAGGNVRCAVGAMLQMHRQRGEVSFVLLEHDLLHRRLLRRHPDGRLQAIEALVDRAQKIALVGAERGGEPLARAHDVADQFGFLGSRRLEQHRPRIAVQRPGDVDEIDGLVAHLALAAVDELVDEIAQPKALGIDRRHGRAPNGVKRRILIHMRFSSGFVRV